MCIVKQFIIKNIALNEIYLVINILQKEHRSHIYK